MSEEVAAAAADLETVRQLRAALEVAMQENEQRMLVERQLRAELEAARAEIARLTAWQRPGVDTSGWFWL
jgi:hypothetical protein